MRIYIENSKEMLPRISNEWKKIFNQKFIGNNNKKGISRNVRFLDDFERRYWIFDTRIEKMISGWNG